MSQRRRIEQHRHSLSEMKSILNSMKTIAYMETRRLARFLDTQQAVVTSLEQAATDFLGFYSSTFQLTQSSTPVFVLIGAERSFCGDFNRRLVLHLDARLEKTTQQPLLIAMGSKLYSQMQHHLPQVIMIEGACAVEDVTTRLNQLVDSLTSLQEKYGTLSVTCIYHSMLDGIESHRLSPPFQHLISSSPGFSHPPELNLPAQGFLAELTDYYLLAVLHQILFTSLMMENHQRVMHLEGAGKHLDNKSQILARKANALRQEEIIEEIEVILLNASSID